MDSVIDRPVSDRFGFTLFMAIALHAMAILGIAFTSTPSVKPVSTLEITLSPIPGGSCARLLDGGA